MVRDYIAEVNTSFECTLLESATYYLHNVHFGKCQHRRFVAASLVIERYNKRIDAVKS